MAGWFSERIVETGRLPFAVIAITGLLLLGIHPFLVEDVRLAVDEEPAQWWWSLPPTLLVLGFTAITVLKGKIWTGLRGCAIRSAGPKSGCRT